MHLTRKRWDAYMIIGALLLCAGPGTLAIINGDYLQGLAAPLGILLLVPLRFQIPKQGQCFTEVTSPPARRPFRLRALRSLYAPGRFIAFRPLPFSAAFSRDPTTSIRLVPMKTSALSFLSLVLVGCSQPPREPTPWARGSGWVCIGVYSGNDAEVAIATLLKNHEIPSEMGDGSVVYGVSVPCVYAKRTSHLLLEDSKEKGYWYLPMEEHVRRMADQTIAWLVLTDLDDDMAEGNYARVTGTLEAAIELIPTYPGLYGRCISAYLLKGEPGQARAILERAKKHVPSSWWVWKEREAEIAEAEKVNAR